MDALYVERLGYNHLWWEPDVNSGAMVATHFTMRHRLSQTTKSL